MRRMTNDDNTAARPASPASPTLARNLTDWTFPLPLECPVKATTGWLLPLVPVP